jgi:hypothetical protein
MKMKAVLIFLFLLLILPACRKNILSDLNKNPNKAEDVPLNLLLPSAEVSSALIYGMEISWYSNVIMQLQGGVDRQMKAADHYSIQPQDVNNPWNNAYIHPLPDLKVIISKAEAQSAWAYSGIAKILTAMVLGQLTDCWGDIPYSQALLGDKNTAPAYDKQSDIYATIEQLLKGAKEDFGKKALLSPSKDDLIYGGDLTRWRKTANALLARYYNHLSKLDPQGSATKALAALDEGTYTSSNDEAAMKFGLAATEANPWYQFMTQRNDIRMGKFLVDYMQSSHDPRLPKYATPDANLNFSGSPAGAPDLYTSSIDSFFSSSNSSTWFITYEEVKFIEAEAALRNSQPQRAVNAYNAAVLASISKFGVYDTVFVKIYASETSNTLTLEKIINQKYVSLLTQEEAWTDWRRTGYPAIKAAQGSIIGNAIPRRFPYPSDEVNFNQQHVPANARLIDRVWWDK